MSDVNIHDYRRAILAKSERSDALYRYTRNLTYLAARNKLPKCYAREKEIENIRIAMLRVTKPNVLLVGPSGCGKTALVEGLAQKLEEELFRTWCYNGGEFTSDVLKQYPIICELSVGGIISGAKYRGDFEERLEGIIQGMRDAEGQLVLFIDEAHLLSDLGAADGAVSGANLLKPSLARGEFPVITATTDYEYSEYLAKDKAFLRRFTKVDVKPLPSKQQLDCALGIIRDYAEKTNIEFQVNKVESIIQTLIDGPMSAMQFPNDFVDIVDEMFARARYEHKDKISFEQLQEAVQRRTGCLIFE